VTSWYPAARRPVIIPGRASGVPVAPPPTCMRTIAPGLAPASTLSRIAVEETPCQSAVSMLHMIVCP